MNQKEKKKFYNSSAWESKRLEILVRDCFECQECRRRLTDANKAGVTLSPEDRKIRRATLVHHIKHYEDAPELGLEDDNLEAVCATCHNLLHERVTKKWNDKRIKERVTEEKW